MPISPPWRPGLLLTVVATVLTACSGQPAAPTPSPSGPASLQISLGGLSALGADIGATASASLTLVSADSRPVAYRVSSDSDWLTLDSGASGAVAPGGQAALSLRARCDQVAETRVGHLAVTLSADGAAPLALSAEVRLTCASAADTTPDAFEFAPQTNVAPGVVVTSNAVKVTGINASAPVAVTGATLLVNGQPSSQTSVQAGDVVALRLTAPNDYASSASARLTVGGVTADFSVITRLAPGAPTPGPLTLSASALQFTATGADQRQTVTASQSNYSGGFALGGSCQTIASLSRSQPAVGSIALAVTPTAAGRCTLQISSATATASVNVTITTSGVVVN